MTIETSPATVPLEVVTPIKPSEAIRLGCLLAPVQAFGCYQDAPGTACVVGAMNLGWGKPVDYSDWDVFGAINFLPCPPCRVDLNSLASLTHLNDYHRWTRERIADWLEGLGY